MEDYKQKYEIAIKKAKEELKTCGTLDCDAARQLFRLFPELKKSEDERIKKEIIQFLQLSHPQFIGERNQEKWIAWLEKQDPKKHEEELENAYKCADEVQYRRGYEDAKREFKKQGEQKLAWSEEDEDYYDAIIAKLEVTQGDALLTDNQMEFLKSLKERYAWKPSDEQMAILWDTIGNLKHDNYEFVSVIYELYNDLKKLREE